MVRFFTEDTSFPFKEKSLVRRWYRYAALSEGKKLGDVNIIFCSDAYLLEINRKYLSHDYFTDIITFDYCEGNTLSGDLFISVDSVKENSSFYGSSFETELRRVIIHGLLHLVGYDDHCEKDIAVMRGKEDFYLSALQDLTADD